MLFLNKDQEWSICFMTISEKILASHAKQNSVRPGEIVQCEVDTVMSTDSTSRVLPIFEKMGGKFIWDQSRLVIPLDHWVPADSVSMADAHRTVRQFAKDQNLKYFYDVKAGVCHQVFCENGHAVPGALIVGKDSHTTTYGAFGAFSTGMGETDTASIYLDGSTWFKVPETIKIILNGPLPKNTVGKDIALFLIGQLGIEFANYRAIEYYGTAIQQLSMAGRMTLCNISMEMGAKAAIIPPDEVTFSFLRQLGISDFSPVYSDDNSSYCDVLSFDVSHLEPQIALPGSPGNSVPISDMPDVRVDQVYLGSCTNGRLEDLKSAAEYLRGKQIAGHVRMYVAPASQKVYKDALHAGYIESLVDAGAIILNPSCGACIGSRTGLLAPGEICVSTCNRNYPGRMGSVDSRIYLCGPLVAAACAAAGYIKKPEV